MGATGEQEQLQQEQITAYQDAAAMTAKQYANQQAIYAPMAKQFQSIFDLGKNQEGFSQEEKDTLNSQAIEGTATNYKQAATAVNENLAAEGGGNESMPSGGADQLKQEVANSAAGNESQQETQIKEADYNQGYQQWLSAGQGLEAIAAGDNPLGYQQNQTSAGSAASTTANQIASEDNSWINAAIGAAGTIGKGVMSGWTSP
jgi:hypothetical protein